MTEIDVWEALPVLERTPAVLRALLSDLREGWLERTEGEGTFGPKDILCHLIHGERTDWVPRIRQILDSADARPFVPFDRRGFADLAGRSVGELLDEFEALRRGNLDVVRGQGLGPSHLGLPGRHPELGPVSLGQLLATWVVHDLNHIAQAVRVMSKRYSGAVGPWNAYLRILNT